MKGLSRIGLLTLLAVLALGSAIVSSQQDDEAVAPVVSSSVSTSTLLGLRLDIETLADRALGGGSRPELWTGNADPASPSVLSDLWFDNEQVADGVFGAGIRPADWAGVATNNSFVVVRNIRHDLELAAEALLGDERPTSWVGSVSQIELCNRELMNIAFVFQAAFNSQFETATTVANFCTALRLELEADFIQGRNTGSPDNAATAQLNLAVRGDLERLADELFGLNTRPDGWIRNTDVTSRSLLTDNFSDLQLLADTTLGTGERPEGAIDSVATADLSAIRNMRYDIELLADATLGEDVRPRGWQGLELPLGRCVTDLQNLYQLVEFVYGFELAESPLTGADYCREVGALINVSAENPPTPEDIDQAVDDRFLGESRNAFAYLDITAQQYMGPLPWGVEFRAWYRNFNGSTMMFVSGDDFALYVDRRWTTLPEDVFLRLPTLEETRPLTFCDAAWCNGPQPTPTPTGSGPLLEIITGATPPATIAPEEVVNEGKQQVGWANIRITYTEQFPERGVAQVVLEICSDTTQIACEPVLSVFDNNAGFVVAPIGVAGALNVYELPYGYSQNLLIEGVTLFSTDIWLNDPTLG